MFKIAAISAFTLIFVGCVSKIDFENDISKMKLQGNIKSIKTETYNTTINHGKPTKNHRVTNGRLNGDIVNFIVFFNKSGFIESISYLDTIDQLQYREIFNYNISNLNDESNTYYPDGTLRKKAIKVFNKNNKYYKIFHYSYNGRLIQTVSVQRDENGNILEEQLDKSFPVENLLSLYEYNANNLNIKKRVFERNYSYENSNLNGKRIIKDEILHTFESKYDSNNLLIEFKKLGKDNQVVFDCKYSYNFDEHGNWIQQTEYNMDNPEIITTRKIIYY